MNVLDPNNQERLKDPILIFIQEQRLRFECRRW
jgi:hypothetical protein